jgi:hypothetical protein
MGKGKGDKWKGLNRPKKSILTVGIHRQTPFNIDLEINNQRQNYKKRYSVWEGTCGRGESE